MAELDPISPREPMNMPTFYSHDIGSCYTPHYEKKQSPAISRVKLTDSLEDLVKKGEMRKSSPKK